MRSCDLFGDLAQGRIARAGILEPIFGDRDGMSTAVPFANKTRSWLQAEARRRANPTRCPQALRDRAELATRRFTEPAVLDFLKSVAERKDQEVATDPRCITVVQPPPFTTQFLEAERPKAIDLALDRSSVQPSHG